MLGPQASDSPFRQLPKTSMKKPLIQDIKIATKEKRVCYISGVSPFVKPVWSVGWGRRVSIKIVL